MTQKGILGRPPVAFLAIGVWPGTGLAPMDLLKTVTVEGYRPRTAP